MLMLESSQGNLNFMVSQAGFILVLSLLCNGARFQMSFKNISQKDGFTKGFASTWRHGSGQSIAAGHGMIKYECVLACPVVFCIRVMFCGCEQTAANKKKLTLLCFCCYVLGAGLWALVGSMCFFPRIVSLFFPKVVQ